MFSYAAGNQVKDKKREDNVITQIKAIGSELFSSTTVQDKYNNNDQSLSLIISESSIDNNSRQTRSLSAVHIKNVLKQVQITPDRKNKYARDYTSPYCQEQLKNTQHNNIMINRISNQIFQYQTQRINLEKNQSPQRFSKNQSVLGKSKKYSTVVSRYQNIEMKPIMDQFHPFLMNNMKEEAQIIHRMNSKKKKWTREQSEERWDHFLKRQQKWNQQKKLKSIQRNTQMVMLFNDYQAKKNPLPARPKKDLDECIRKIKRDTLKLKQKLLIVEKEDRKYFDHNRSTQRDHSGNSSQRKSGRKTSPKKKLVESVLIRQKTHQKSQAVSQRKVSPFKTSYTEGSSLNRFTKQDQNLQTQEKSQRNQIPLSSSQEVSFLLHKLKEKRKTKR